jgi:glyoxylase I family protein
MAEFILGMHHVSMLVKDTERSMRFYTNVLGMRTVVRPDLGFPGAWLAVGEQQIHLLELPNPDPVENRPVHGGRDRHLALRVADLSRLTSRLEQTGIDYTLSKSGRAALFCRDPDGNGLEFIQS